MAVTFGGSGVFPNGGGGGGGTATPGGSDTEVQYNDGGVLNGADGLTYTKATETTTAESVGAKVVAVTGLATPDAPTVTPNTVGEATWGYKVVALLADDSHSIASSEGTTVAGSATLEANVYNTIEWSAVAGANYYAVYRTTVATDPTTTGLVGTTTGLSLVDNALVGDTTSAPTTNTTGLVTTPQIKVTGGTPGSGKVLTSDAAGLGTWQAAGGLSGGSAGRLAIWSGASTVTSNAATMADPTTGVVTLGPPSTDVTMLTARASAAPGTAHIAQFQASDNSPLSHIAHDGKFVGNVTGTASGNPTNSAGANVVTKSDGTNLVASSVSDNGTTLTLGNAGVTVTEATGAVGLTAQAVGTTPLAVAGASGQTASLLTVTGGATPGASYSPMLSVTGTLPASPSGAVAGVSHAITSAGSAAQYQRGMQTTLAAGYTGSKATYGLWTWNAAAGTGADPHNGAANIGSFSMATASTTGWNIGHQGYAEGSSAAQIGLYGSAYAVAAQPTIGVYGASTFGTVGFGGYFTLHGGSPTLPSGRAALAADNAATASAIIVARDSGSAVFSVEDGGYLTGAQGGVAGTVKWGLPAAAPQAYSHTLSASSRGGTDTDVAGAAATVRAGNGTGTGGSGTLKAQTAYPGTTGTTANTYSDREVFAPKWTTLTESSATAIATLTFGASSVVGAEFLVTIESNDGTDYQALTSRVRVSSVRKATGNTVSTVALVGTDLLAESAGTSTLTATYTLTEGASAVTLNVNAVSSLTQTTLRATFQAVSNGPACTIAQS